MSAASARGRLPGRRFAVQLLLPIVALGLAFLAVGTFYWSRAFEQLTVGALAERLQGEARLVARALPWDERGAALDRMCGRIARDIGGRITVVAADGTVLGDSHADSSSIENHANRPEVAAARRTGAGRAVRLSATVGERMLYYAVLDRQAGRERFVRLAQPLRELARAESMVRRTLVYGFLAALAVGGGAAWLMSRRVLARVRRIEVYSRQIASGGPGALRVSEIPTADDELGALERNLVSLAEELRDRVAAAEDERSKLEVVLLSMADGVVVLDGEGRIQLCNESARNLLGIPSAPDAAPVTLTFLCRNPELDALVEEILHDGASGVQREITIPGRDGMRTTLVSGAPLPEAEGPHGAILVFHDVTRLRQLEIVRADFVANVSHELRTPLTAIRGYAETLLHGALDQREKAVQFLGVIDRQSRRLARLIDDLLSLSDLELGRTELHRYPTSIASLVEGVFETLRPHAAGRAIVLESTMAPDLPKLRVDRDRMEEVLVNLVENAIKYSGEGTSVRVSAGVAADGRGIEVAVSDQGIGIPERDIPRITERFYRVDKARSRELGGTGLGLAIVKHIVQAHGGELRIESRVGAGTTVTVWLPRGADDGNGAREA